MDNYQQPSEAAIKLLRERPDFANHFDQKYGQGAAASYLKPRTDVTEARGEAEGKGFFGTAADMLKAVPDGIRDGLQETIDLAGGIGDYMVEEWGVPDTRPAWAQDKPTRENALPDFENGPDTAGGHIVKGISQFITGYALGGRALKFVQPATKAGKLGKTFVQGAVADFVAFDEHEARLSNMVNEYFPEYANSVTEYLAADKDDDMFEGRVKNLIEGGLTGVLAEGAVAVGKAAWHVIKATRKAGKLYKAGDEQAAMEEVAKASEEAEKILEGTPGSKYVADDVSVRNSAQRDADELPATYDDRVRVNRPVKDPDLPESPLSHSEVDDVIKGFTTEEGILDNVGAASGKGGINPKKWVDNSNAVAVADALASVIRSKTSDAFDGVQSMKQMEKLAKQFSMDVPTLQENMRALGIATKDMPAQLQAATDVLVRGFNQVSELAVKYGDDLDAMPKEVQVQVSNILIGMAELSVSRGLVQKHSARALRFAQRTAKEASVDDVSAKQMIDAMRDGENVRQLLRQAARHKHKPSRMVKLAHATMTGKGLDKLNEFWINSLLSHPRTHIINMMSGSIESVIRPLEDALGRALTGDFKGAAGHMVGTYQAFRHHVVSSRAFMKDIMSVKNIDDMTMDDLSELAKSSPFYGAFQAMMKENNILDPFHRQYDVPDHAIAGTKGKVIRTASRFLSAEDEFMKQMNYRNKIIMDEYAIGYRNGKSHKEIQKAIADRMEKAYAKADDVEKGLTKGEGTDDAALQYARETTFTEDLNTGAHYMFGNIGRTVQKNVVEHPVLRQVMPFVRVPVNLFRHSFQRFPILGAFQADMRQAIFYGTSQQRARAIAKQLVGMTFAAEAINYAIDGRLTGYGPTDPNERRTLMDTGWQPYSFKLSNGEYLQYSRLDPRFTIFGMVADLTERWNNSAEGERDELLWAIPAAMGQNLSSKSFHQGLQNIFEALSSGDDNKLKLWATKQSASYVPNVLTLATSDEVKAPTGPVEGFMSKVPFLESYVDPKRNVFGEAKHRYGALGPDSISPLFVSKDSDSPIDRLMAESQHGYQLPAKRVPGTRIKLTDYEKENGQTAWDRWQELTGTVTHNGMTLRQTLEDLVPQLQELPATADPGWDHVTSKRDQAIQQVIGAFRQLAFEEMQDEFPGLREKIEKQKVEGATVSAGGTQALQNLINH